MSSVAVTRRLGPAGQLGRVDAHLVGPVRIDPDQFHVVAPDDRVQRSLADVAGRPLNHPKGSVNGAHLSNLHVRSAVDTDLCSCDDRHPTTEHRYDSGDGVRFGEDPAVVERQDR